MGEGRRHGGGCAAETTVEGAEDSGAAVNVEQPSPFSFSVYRYLRVLEAILRNRFLSLFLVLCLFDYM